MPLMSVMPLVPLVLSVRSTNARVFIGILDILDIRVRLCMGKGGGGRFKVKGEREVIRLFD